MLLAVLVLAFLVAIPNAKAAVALLDGITLLAASRTQQFGWGGPIFRGRGFGGIIILPLRGIAERHGAKQRIKHRCLVLFR